MKKRILIWGATLVVCLTAFLYLFPIHREVTIVCNNTASVRSYDVWFIFIRINNEYRESPIETYMKKNHPSELKYDWHTVRAIPRNIEGRILANVCFAPPPFVVMLLTHESSHQMIAELPDEQKYELYQILSDKTKSELESHDLVKVSGGKITIKSPSLPSSSLSNMPEVRKTD